MVNLMDTNCMRPVFFKNDCARWPLGGCKACFFLKLRDRFFAVTAKHVVEKYFKDQDLELDQCLAQCLIPTPTPNLKPLIGRFKVEPAVPCFMFWRLTRRLFLMPSRSVARPRRGGSKSRGRSVAMASLAFMF